MNQMKGNIMETGVVIWFGEKVFGLNTILQKDWIEIIPLPLQPGSVIEDVKNTHTPKCESMGIFINASNLKSAELKQLSKEIDILKENWLRIMVMGLENASEEIKVIPVTEDADLLAFEINSILFPD